MLKHSEPQHDSASPGFAHLILHQADWEQATELVIGVAPSVGGTQLKYKIAGAWHNRGPFPSQLRSGVIAQLARMANCPEGQFPIDAILTLSYKDFPTNKDGQSSWRAMIPSAEAECILMRIKNQGATAAN